MRRIRALHAVGTPVLLGSLLTSLIIAGPAGAEEAAVAAPAPARVQPGQVFRIKPGLRWVLPVASFRLTGRFGDVSGLWSSTHTGLDFATDLGSPIRSVARGVVVEAAYDGSYGYKTVVRLSDGSEVWYCHQASLVASVGQTLMPGDLVGYVGMTGNVTGPHLHLEVRRGGVPVDPYPILAQHGLRP